eukprot:TRINITY_DN12964_c0_g1_i2.p1 TRINITY_DN12964_c0_g1~~TRINITY_DN12964_c0_g1_i2.p1  ORF type:complete len:107 (-),score=6.13 TRINITY_DN12964_c0_g1_i2:242-562(-)
MCIRDRLISYNRQVNQKKSACTILSERIPQDCLKTSQCKKESSLMAHHGQQLRQKKLSNDFLDIIVEVVDNLLSERLPTQTTSPDSLKEFLETVSSHSLSIQRKCL